MSRNNVRGPTSALTEFLKESGITATSIARRAATRLQPPQQPVAGPSNSRDNGVEGDEEAGPSAPRRNTRSNAPAAGYNSDDLDDEDEDETPKTKKRKLTKAAEAKLKAKAKRKAKNDGDIKDDDGDDEEEDAYTALSKNMWKNASGLSGKPANGSLEDCAKCEKQFTVTQYTMAANPPPGYLCHACAKASGNDPFKKAAPRKRKAPVDKRTVTHFEERRFPSLVSLCVKMISDHINDVEALGDIGANNVDNIIRALSRNRSLTAENVALFYNVQNENLTIYDATNLLPPAFSSLAMLNPNLTHLRLELCGRMDDTVLETWTQSLPNLTHLDLHGPFLVHPEAWIDFFQAHPKLESFQITQSPRFDLECMHALVQSCQKLHTLRLKQIGQLNDDFVEEIKGLKLLVALDLSEPATSCSEEALIGLVKELGPKLETLNLSGHTLITDEFLEKGLREHATHLTSLMLNNLTELTDQGVGALFEAWREAGVNLTSVELARNPELREEALTALLACTGPSLTTLTINGWRMTSEEALAAIGVRARELRKLDVGWNREVNDMVMQMIMNGCDRLEEVKCWGCNKLTVNCPRKLGVSILGVESHTSA
ncbi:hypothetical protein OF83DRAFT_1168539 [Amylostereum chailletii]|nr:hypothetical protein OF83DRAFT_1168539 [Amylostereum chailletii]